MCIRLSMHMVCPFDSYKQPLGGTSKFGLSINENFFYKYTITLSYPTFRMSIAKIGPLKGLCCKTIKSKVYEKPFESVELLLQTGV